ncbi:MFS transporter [Nonomuraea sp. NPDC050663]|uniref:MFS transporter n=1 Tax=Nonomuraea sp. NPDC050663 TaxID=3364370 RepID=UPI0037AB1EE6
MSAQPADPRPSRANLVLATLFLGMFVAGSSELLVVGVLDLIAADLRLTIPAAGSLVTAYALGLALGGPIMTALTIRLNKRTVLIGALAAFVAGSLVVMMTDSYPLMLAARTLTGAVQGLFIAAAFATGISVVPPERMGRAIGVVVSGVSVSGAIGVPLGTLASQSIGWRGSFAAIAALSAIMLIATLAVVPSVPSQGAGARDQVRHALAPRVLAVLALGSLLFASVYAALTYIVPFLQEVTGISGALISVYILAYGVATAVGSFVGGRFADTNATRTLTVAAIGATLCLLVLHFVGTIPVLVALTILAWGVFAFVTAPAFQYRVISLAGPGGALAQSLPASAANLGIAFGSYAGGAAIGAFSTSAAITAALVLSVITIPVAWATGLLRPPPATQPATQPEEAGV